LKALFSNTVYKIKDRTKIHRATTLQLLSTTKKQEAKVLIYKVQWLSIRFSSKALVAIASVALLPKHNNK
jgi:hypothetical protein